MKSVSTRFLSHTLWRGRFSKGIIGGSPGGPPLPCFPSLYLKIVWVFAEGKAQNAHTLRFPFDPFQVSLAN